MAGLWHDQVRLQRISVLGFGVRLSLSAFEICKRNYRFVYRVEVGQRERIPCFVLPGLKMHDFGSTDAEQYPQNLATAYLLSEGCVQTGAALLNEGKVKSCGESDSL